MESKLTCCFIQLQDTNVPHVVEKIFFYLDYDSFKKCMDVNTSWRELLRSEAYQMRAKSIFKKKINHDELKLYAALKTGKINWATELLSSGLLDADLQGACRGLDLTPLYKAASEGHCEIVQLLIRYGADINGHNGFLPMHAAAEEGHADVVRIILDFGMHPNKEDRRGLTALQRAAAKGHTNVARLLLDAGAEVDKTDKLGETALHHAAHFGQMDVLELLVMSGADRKKTNHKGESPIAIAQMKNYILPPRIYYKL